MIWYFAAGHESGVGVSVVSEKEVFSTTAEGLMSIEQVLVKWKLLERAVEDLLRLMS